MRVVAVILDPKVIKRILDYLRKRTEPDSWAPLNADHHFAGPAAFGVSVRAARGGRLDFRERQHVSLLARSARISVTKRSGGDWP